MDPESGLDAVLNLGIRDGTIQIITPAPIRGRATVNARGLVVAPGFIDLHQLTLTPEAQRFKVLDGVTAAFDMMTGVADVDAWYTMMLERRSLIHYGATIGHIPVRTAVLMGSAPRDTSGNGAAWPASPEQITQIRERVEHGLQRGALGVGLDLGYNVLGTTPWETIEMFRAAAAFPGAPVHVKVRKTDRPHHWLETGEIFLAALASGAPMHIVGGSSAFGSDAPRLMEMIEAARARGLDVTTDAYPYTAGMATISHPNFDNWETWLDEEFGRYSWALTGERLTRESFGIYRRTGGSIVRDYNTEERLRTVLASPATLIVSFGELQDGTAHPRLAGTYARVLGYYVREEGLLTLMEALRRMTLMPSQFLEARAPAMKNKGRIRMGADADLTIFDPATVLDRATFAEPLLPSAGIRYVLVDGVLVVNDGVLNDSVAPGRAIRAPVRRGAR